MKKLSTLFSLLASFPLKYLSVSLFCYQLLPYCKAFQHSFMHNFHLYPPLFLRTSFLFLYSIFLPIIISRHSFLSVIGEELLTPLFKLLQRPLPGGLIYTGLASPTFVAYETTTEKLKWRNFICTYTSVKLGCLGGINIHLAFDQINIKTYGLFRSHVKSYEIVRRHHGGAFRNTVTNFSPGQRHLLRQ